jgi:Kef-type K+ transport system membrane component KefB
MHSDPVLFTVFLIFSGAAVLATLALFAHQALLVAYILVGILFGPWVFKLVVDPVLIQEVGHIGIMFLLFLLGLNLHPQKLVHLIRETTAVTAASSLAFALPGIVIGALFGLSWTEALLLGATLMFSSTIIGLKLLPTTVLHHQRMGEIMISILLLQDIIAVLIILLLQVQGSENTGLLHLALALLSLPALFIFAFLFERYVLIKLIRRFERIQEYIFLVVIGWCLGMAELAAQVELSSEIGAFIAGVALAASRISLFISETLKPVRDFFLVMFFFSLGAGFNVQALPEVVLPASLLTGITLLLKPWVFRVLFQHAGEPRSSALEMGVRLGQISEFAFLIAILAVELAIISPTASYLIQTCALLSFIVSPYVIVLRFPTPIALSDRLRRD